MVFLGSGNMNSEGHLEIGDVDTVDLAKEFGTPLYVYDVAKIREQATAYLSTFKKRNVTAKVAYASKAFSCIAMVQLMQQEGLHLDVVSGGELFTALQAGFPATHIHFHGNNKSIEELTAAVEEGVGSIVVDNFYELDCLKSIGESLNRVIPIQLRITPGIEAHTHEYILTGQEDSKFGFDLISKQADQALHEALSSSYIDMMGIHCHIGSQIFESDGFVMAIRKIFDLLEDWSESFGYEARVVNLGGGFGIAYTTNDKKISIEEMMNVVVDEVQDQVAEKSLAMPEIWIEPGRSIVGEAGTTLYTVGSEKRIPGVRNYLAVDGGMTDNLRPALYQAKYEAVIANRLSQKNTQTVSIAGKCCESGDMLIQEVSLPKTSQGDILAMFCTGAYGYSMANNYNRLPRPAVVFVEEGEAQLVVERETYRDLVHLDRPLKKTVVTSF
ncbi:diaminopimelate decarboxylase [Pseudalkalibacillus berkeleyi]|uniref:Diaminopimelate decarboxylase n=1 Tax=Pseudalkalibacillus berkeleyi TaxID=1069813 RepID=A0ABS9H0P8_9BACL|nr:diaminopimelate decarboxylase [Pseudalkalibacillus berkeleyi]MCF6137641.1 diaminopimelate decarboxylase [Pseudalkalibacillus berkeleyi]